MLRSNKRKVHVNGLFNYLNNFVNNIIKANTKFYNKLLDFATTTTIGKLKNHNDDLGKIHIKNEKEKESEKEILLFKACFSHSC